jgi:hypothetical protein
MIPLFPFLVKYLKIQKKHSHFQHFCLDVASAVYESPRITSCVEARQTRKRLLNQHRLAKRGNTTVTTF